MANRSSLIGQTVSTRYRLVGALVDGSGSSMVFNAVDTRSRKQVVVRLVPGETLLDLDSGVDNVNDALELFKRRTKDVAAITHPALVSVDDWGTETIDGQLFAFTVFEYFAGGTLREILDRGRRLTPSQALVVGLDICRGLNFVHGKGLVHGDVRPANVFIGDDLRVRLGGLGIKRTVVAKHLSLEQSRFAAPEIGLGEAPSEFSDIYSLAMTLVESITGEVPFSAESVALTLAARVGKLLRVSADLGAIAAPIERAGRPEASERFTALGFGQALAQIAGKMPAPTPIQTVMAKTFEEVMDTQEAENTAELRRIEASKLAETMPKPIKISDALAGLDDSKPISIEIDSPAKTSGRKRLWSVLAVVALAVSAVVIYQNVVSATHTVPDILGVSEGEARNLIAANNWNIVVASERSDEVAQGNIVRTDPEAGVDLEEGKSFTIYISDGPTLAPLPDINGLALQEATDMLTAVGLTADVKESASEDVPAGIVVSWLVPQQTSLITNDKVLRGTSVEVIVSTGPGLREVPLIVGMTLEEATALASNLRLTLVAGEPSLSNAAAKGLIGAQAPVPGEKVERDSTFIYSISLGLDLVKMPNIVGNNYVTVEKRLLEAGFVVGKVTGKKTFRMRQAESLGVRVNNGDMVARGAVIDLTFP